MTGRIMVALVAFAAATCMADLQAGRAQEARAEAHFQPFKTVWSGVYAKDEADRGKRASAQLCGGCHGVNLKGSEKAPQLTGPKFFERWNNLRLLDVVAYIQSAMPHEHEFFASPEATREIVGFMLQESGVPAGQAPMSKDVNELSEVLITKPAGR